METPEQFWSKVAGGDFTECWVWTGSRSSGGYGNLKWAAKNAKAHRVAWELINGPIPVGLQLDHLCRVRHCVNPWHLEPVTNRVNVLRGVAPSATCATRTHCPLGHPLSGENLKIGKRSSGATFRTCRACANEYSRRARARSAA